MTEIEAKTWISEKYSATLIAKIELFCALLVQEAGKQNLIAPSTIPVIWARHIVDSAQLLALAPSGWKHWADIGTGAGLPGIIVATLTGRRVTMIEPRRLRVEFLQRCIRSLGLANATVVQAKADRANLDVADVISARAVAGLDALFNDSQHFATSATTYLLPKGEGAKTELEAAQMSWQGVFHVKQSVVDPMSGIIVARGVCPR